MSQLALESNAWFRSHGRRLPWREPGFGTWGILVSEVMLQQTPAARVTPRLEEWLERWPSPADLAASPAGEAVRAWQRLGYPRRALNLHAAAVTITERHGGVVPAELDELLALPGVGTYTARAVAVFGYGRRHPVVDINVRRVLARAVAGHGEAGPASATRDLAAMSAVLPPDDAEARTANASLMELGAVVCTARAPRCGECPVAGLCAWRLAGYPQFQGKRAPVHKRFEGSDRQVRGIILAQLRGTHIPITAAEVDTLWPDRAQLERALAGLAADGLVVAGPDGFELP